MQQFSPAAIGLRVGVDVDGDEVVQVEGHLENAKGGALQWSTPFFH